VPLLPEDAAFLRSRGYTHEVHEEGGMTCLVLKGVALPIGLSESVADVLIRFAPGYPDIAPDMWWVSPHLTTANGQTIPATESVESYLGRSWQRWSRHFEAGQWHVGIDRLQNFVVLLVAELRRAADSAAA
jgi:hypothetical protein